MERTVRIAGCLGRIAIAMTAHRRRVNPMCDDMPMPKVTVCCPVKTCRWSGPRHPDTAIMKPCPRCGARVIPSWKYDEKVREERRELMRRAATQEAPRE
jgi:hypothetical protein